MDSQILEQVKKESTGMDAIKFKIPTQTPSGKDVDLTRANIIVQNITKTCNVYPLEPHFYIAKLGYAGVNDFFLFLLQNIDCGYSLEPPRRGGSNVYPQFMFRAKIRKISKIFY